MVISTLENDKTSATALREITARGFKLTVIAPDTLDYDRDSRIISPTVYFTASASFDSMYKTSISFFLAALSNRVAKSLASSK